MTPTTPPPTTTTMTMTMESRLGNETAAAATRRATRSRTTRERATTTTTTTAMTAMTPTTMAMTPTPRTRRAAREMKRRRENEERSALLGTLPEDALRRVCEFLSARELATLERVSSYFYRSPRRNDRGLGMCETVARGRVRRECVEDMPKFYGYARARRAVKTVRRATTDDARD